MNMRILIYLMMCPFTAFRDEKKPLRSINGLLENILYIKEDTL